MATLLCNIPSIDVWVRKEYLRNHIDGHGEFVRGVWAVAKSIQYRAFYFETYLPDYGAMYDKLPISAFVAQPATPTPDLPLHELQFWNAMDYGVVAVRKSFLREMDVEVFTRQHGVLRGRYLFTLDNYHPDADTVDSGVSENPPEHKSHNVIALENGQFVAYPNNRLRFIDTSLTPEQLLRPDLKASTTRYEVEAPSSWGRLGATDDYLWKTDQEQRAEQKKA
jgi:hypothetical protein